VSLDGSETSLEAADLVAHDFKERVFKTAAAAGNRE